MQAAGGKAADRLIGAVVSQRRVAVGGDGGVGLGNHDTVIDSSCRQPTCQVVVAGVAAVRAGKRQSAQVGERLAGCSHVLVTDRRAASAGREALTVDALYRGHLCSSHCTQTVVGFAGRDLRQVGLSNDQAGIAAEVIALLVGIQRAACVSSCVGSAGHCTKYIGQSIARAELHCPVVGGACIGRKGGQKRAQQWRG